MLILPFIYLIKFYSLVFGYFLIMGLISDLHATRGTHLKINRFNVRFLSVSPFVITFFVLYLRSV